MKPSGSPCQLRCRRRERAAYSHPCSYRNSPRGSAGCPSKSWRCTGEPSEGRRPQHLPGVDVMEESDAAGFLATDHMQRHQSLPETTSDATLRARRNATSTPKRATRSKIAWSHAGCHTDPVPRTRPRTSSDHHSSHPFTTDEHLPTPIRPRASPVEIVSWFAAEAKHISVVSGHPWTCGPSSGELVVPGPSLASSSGPICRICHEGDHSVPLTSYCSCTGTMGLLHSPCLERWLNISHADSCELCHQRFPTSRVRRTLAEWYREAPGQRRALCNDLICFVLLSPIAGMGLELCVQGATSQATTRQIMQAGSLIALSVLLITAFLAWSYLTVRCHYRSFRSWREDNAKVFLVPRRDDVRVDVMTLP